MSADVIAAIEAADDARLECANADDYADIITPTTDNPYPADWLDYADQARAAAQAHAAAEKAYAAAEQAARARAAELATKKEPTP